MVSFMSQRVIQWATGNQGVETIRATTDFARDMRHSRAPGTPATVRVEGS